MKKWITLPLFLTIVCFFLSNGVAESQTTYTWIGGTSSSWATSSNWSPTRTTPATDDIMVFDASGTVTATNLPTQTIGQLLISNGTTVNLQAGGAVQLSIGGGAGTDLDIPSGNSLNFNANNAITLRVLTGATAAIAGNMTFSASSNTGHRLTAADVGGITFSSGAIFTAGTNATGNAFGTTDLGSVIFGSGSTYVQLGAGSNPFGASQPNSVVVFQTGSLYKTAGNNTGPSFSGRTYADVEFAGTGTSTMTGSAAVSIDNLTITSGTININMTGTPGHSIKGNITQNGGSLSFSPSSAGTINLSGGGTQTITGTFSTGGNATINVPSGSTVDFGGSNTITGSGTFTLASGAKLITANLDGIAATGATGSVRTSTRNFNTGATYEYNGTSSQFTGTGVPTTVSDLIINNSVSVVMSKTIQVTGTLTLTSGTFDINGFNLTFSTISPAPVWGNTSTTYILAESGLVTFTDPSSTVFPIGTTSYYLPCRLTGSGSFSVQLTTNTMPDDPTSTLPAQWTITGPGGSFTPEFQWPGAAEGANMSANRSNLYLFKASGGVPTSYGPASAAGGDPYTISFGSVPCCSDFIVGAESTFPVELISFKAKKLEDGVELDWKTASEINNDYFSVERSSDGNVFREIGNMPGNGTSLQTNSYSFFDQAPAPGLNYYRLRQVDFNGNYSVSGMVSVKIDSETGLVKLYPTSASSEVNIQLPADLEESASIQIIGLDGKRIQSFRSEPGRTLVNIPLDAMSNGIYFVKIVFGTNTQTLQFVKQ